MGTRLRVTVASLALAASASHAQPDQLPPLKYVSENGVCQFYAAAPLPSKTKGNVIAAVYTTCNVGGSRPSIAYNSDGTRENLDRENWSYADWFEVRCSTREARAISSAKFARQFWSGDANKTKPSPVSSAFVPFPDPKSDIWYGGAVAWACQRQAEKIPSM